MGHRRAAELLLLGEPFSAEVACDLGIVNAVLPAVNCWQRHGKGATTGGKTSVSPAHNQSAAQARRNRHDC